jgi:hypothetical protein
MTVRRRNVLLLGTLAAAVAAATPIWGQTAVLAVGSANSVTQGATSIPDFSGIWGHPYLPGFEPPVSGPGPVVNTSRKRQLFGADGPMAPGTNVLVTDIDKVVGDFTNPILKPQTAEAVRKFGEMELSGKAAPSPSNQCWPEPVPYILWHMGMQMLQQPGKITILYFSDHEVRHIRMNEPHPASVTPSWYGDSVGHYEGDTLVIDTVGIKTDRPFAMVDWYGTPYTKALHVVERYRLIDYEEAKAAQERGGNENWRIPGPGAGWAPAPNYKGKGLQLQFTVEDDGAFTTPWSATMTYRRPVTTEWPEVVCSENTHEYYAGKNTEVPRADRPDF